MIDNNYNVLDSLEKQLCLCKYILYCINLNKNVKCYHQKLIVLNISYRQRFSTSAINTIKYIRSNTPTYNS